MLRSFRNAAPSVPTVQLSQMQQALEEWAPSEWRKAAEPVARAVAAACGDAAADTRSLGRRMYAALKSAAPDTASAALAAMTPTAQRQLLAAATLPAVNGSAASGTGSRCGSAGGGAAGGGGSGGLRSSGDWEAGGASCRPGSGGTSFRLPPRAAAVAAAAQLAAGARCAGRDEHGAADGGIAMPPPSWRADGGIQAAGGCADETDRLSAPPVSKPRRSVGLPRRVSIAGRRASQPVGASLGNAATPMPAALQHRHSAAGGLGSMTRLPRRVSAPSAAGCGGAADAEAASGGSSAGAPLPSLRSLVIAIQSAGQRLVSGLPTCVPRHGCLQRNHT